MTLVWQWSQHILSTVELPNNERIGTANFSLFVYGIYKSIEEYTILMVHWNNFIMRGYLLLGEFIIGGSTVLPSVS